MELSPSFLFKLIGQAKGKVIRVILSQSLFGGGFSIIQIGIYKAETEAVDE
jgi:hypothetical protein